MIAICTVEEAIAILNQWEIVRVSSPRHGAIHLANEHFGQKHGINWLHDNSLIENVSGYLSDLVVLDRWTFAANKRKYDDFWIFLFEDLNDAIMFKMLLPHG